MPRACDRGVRPICAARAAAPDPALRSTPGCVNPYAQSIGSSRRARLRTRSPRSTCVLSLTRACSPPSVGIKGRVVRGSMSVPARRVDPERPSMGDECHEQLREVPCQKKSIPEKHRELIGAQKEGRIKRGRVRLRPLQNARANKLFERSPICHEANSHTDAGSDEYIAGIMNSNVDPG
jgi:hypothetical protein